MGSRIKITSGKETEFYSKFQLDSETYEAVTEDLGVRKAQIITRIYLKGEIRSTTTSDYADQAKQPNIAMKLRVMMEEQHKSAVETFIREQSNQLVNPLAESPADPLAEPPTKTQKSKAEYAEAIRMDLKSNKKAALGSAREALEKFPDDPFFLSYCGYLTATVEGKSREGSGMCEAAISILRKSKSTDIAFFLPLFYLHLGRVHMKADRKLPAIDAFREGLRFDSRNRELLSELKAVGSRQSPVIPFLGRSNPINKYLGKLRHDLQKRK